MNRKEFIIMCGILGLSLPLSRVRTARSETELNTHRANNVIIIGAGAAGLAAGALLQQQGIEFQILEASSIYGGRMKRTTNFANFPISLGAEWIHVEPNILKEIINDGSIKVEIETIQYDPKIDYALYKGTRISMEEIGFEKDSKFINSTWFDFFEQYIVPLIEKHIIYNALVEVIDYSTKTIQVKTQNNVYFADQVIVTVPVKILQNGAIHFRPALPKAKRNAINAIRVWDGCKAFIEFSQKFYPTAVAFEIIPETAGQKLYYDASYGQDTTQNILGLFAVGTGTIPYVALSDNTLIKYILNELDELFDGQASPNYIKHIFQNWNTEPFANGAYVVSHENWRRVRTLGKSVDSQLFFAGDAYTEGRDWGSVHAAARSARRAVEEIISTRK